MSASSSLKHELADHIYQYLCHEAQYSDLPEAAKESLTAASECIEQAYKLNVNPSHNTSNNPTNYNNNTNNNTSTADSNEHSRQDCAQGGARSSDLLLADELLRIFTRHKETSTATVTAASTKHHSQHPISQLPMTTRKKLSHLRAQVKRQASKAARSRLEKRSSVSGVANSSGGDDKGGHFGLGISLDTANSNKLHQQQATSDGYNSHHHHKELHNQPNSSSSTDSPNQQATSSPSCNTANNPSNQSDANLNLSPGQQQNESGASSSETGSKQPGSSHLLAPRSGHHRHKEFGVSVHQKNFKQKLIALLKKFRTDGSDFDSEEQYREALERELMKAAAGRGSRAIEELLEEDIDVEEESGGSELEDWDNISETSTPKPSLRPFFSSTTLDKI